MNRYPLWKYVIVLVALAIGLIYTLPNLFGESPAVQVSSAKSTVRLETNLISHVEELLKKNNIPTTGSYFEQNGPSATARFRFESTDVQLKAKDLIERELNKDSTAAAPDYTVQARVRKTGGKEGFIIGFAAQDADDGDDEGPQRDEEAQARFISARVGDLDVVCVYVPNGQSVGSEKYAYKLRWLEALAAWLERELAASPRLAVLGDFNVAPEDRDVHDPAAWAGQVLFSEPEKAALRKLFALGFADAFRLRKPKDP